MSKKKKAIRGTYEWAVATVDCYLGCKNGCKYCYARYDAVEKKGIISAEEWSLPVEMEHQFTADIPIYSGQVMFPAHHDIHPENIDRCCNIIDKILDGGNRLLLVTKPDLSCIKHLCDRYYKKRKQILFRFTITALSDSILKVWEPCAPSFQERLNCLIHAHESMFPTSVSIEPMLEAVKIEELVGILLPHVTHSIWIGKMNKVDQRVVVDSLVMEREVERIKNEQTNDAIDRIYKRLRHIPEIRWKESIKEVIGVDLAGEAGLDI